MPLLFQNVDTGESLEIEVSDTSLRIRDAAWQIMNRYHLQTPPIFFTIYKEQPTKEMFLEEDDLLSTILEKRLDAKTPIWFRSSELHPDTIYKLRTERFEMSGYKIPEISAKSVLIAGVGLIGADLAMHCATIGIKKLFVLDYGSVDWYNIYRQTLYLKDDVFQPKVEIARLNLKKYGGIEVVPIQLEIPSFISTYHNPADMETALKGLERYIDHSNSCLCP
jgi:hypothetical protein